MTSHHARLLLSTTHRCGRAKCLSPKSRAVVEKLVLGCGSKLREGIYMNVTREDG